MMLKSLMPMVDKVLTDENVSKIFKGLEDEYPVEAGHKLLGTITKEKNDKVYFCIAEMDVNMKIIKVHKQWKLVEGIKFLIDKANGSNE
ncbi:MAG: hypothetical protein GX793_01600 [Bacteroidales bacterium]|nr:hypothetical protein [Bacteroidales bacterium]